MIDLIVNLGQINGLFRERLRAALLFNYEDSGLGKALYKKNKIY